MKSRPKAAAAGSPSRAESRAASSSKLIGMGGAGAGDSLFASVACGGAAARGAHRRASR
ncbi:MAG: hypothetical protein NTX64_10590 [Elusimicrobia bacterium]|nr:hypothetical protein [Elusimicrobiota bacterium]